MVEVDTFVLNLLLLTVGAKKHVLVNHDNKLAEGCIDYTRICFWANISIHAGDIFDL